MKSIRHTIILAASLAVLAPSCSQQNINSDGLLNAKNPLDTNPIVQLYTKAGQPIDLMLDTGAEQPVLLFNDSIVLQQMGLQSQGSNARKHFLELYQRPEQQGLIGKYHPAITAPNFDYQGLAGWELIRRGIWNFDFNSGKHKFVSHLPSDVANWPSLPILPNASVLRVDDGSGRNIVIDTGADRSIYLGNRAWREWKRRNPSAPLYIYAGFSPAAGGWFARESSIAPSFKVGPIELYNVRICQSFVDRRYISGAEIDVIVGMRALLNYNVWIDGPSSRVYLKQTGGKQWINPPVNLAGVVILPSNSDHQQNFESSGYYTLHVLPSSLAWRSGLRSGDKLVAVDGNPRPSMFQLESLLTKPGAKSHWQVKRRYRNIEAKLHIPGKTARPQGRIPAPKFTAPETPAGSDNWLHGSEQKPEL